MLQVLIKRIEEIPQVAWCQGATSLRNKTFALCLKILPKTE